MKQYESLDAAFAGECDYLEFVDNRRAARVGDVEQMKDYIARMEAGCCGRKDAVVSIANQVMLGDELHKWYEPYLIGCNYGH